MAVPGVGTYELPAPGRGPAFSLSSRHKNLDLDQKTPGPGAYDEDAKKLARRAPAFTIRPRWLEKRPGEQTPASNQYDAHWERVARSAPAFSLASRNKNLDENPRTPGPGAYSEENFNLLRPRAPKFTISGRYGDGSADSRKNTPGPGQYDVRRCSSAGPAFSLSSRHRDLNKA